MGDTGRTRAYVRLIDPAVEDLARLVRLDPQVLRQVLKKLLLLERNPEAGEPLLGALVGFRVDLEASRVRTTRGTAASSSSYSVNSPSAPVNTCTSNDAGLPTPSSSGPVSGTIAPARANTGYCPIGRCSCTMRSPAYVTLVKKSVQRPSGNHDDTAPSPVSASAGDVIGSTNSSVPKK